jgi:hypothetical protein
MSRVPSWKVGEVYQTREFSGTFSLSHKMPLWYKSSDLPKDFILTTPLTARSLLAILALSPGRMESCTRTILLILFMATQILSSRRRNIHHCKSLKTNLCVTDERVCLCASIGGGEGFQCLLLCVCASASN